MSNEPFRRSLTFDRSAADPETRTVPLSVSSDTDEVVRYVAGVGAVREVLVHEPGSVDLARFEGETGGPLLFNHDPDTLIGRFSSVSLEGGKWRGVARFGHSPEAERAWQDVQDGILVDVSITYGYERSAVEIAERDKEGKPQAVRVKRWTPYEVSMVTIPADASVGVGRELVLDLEDRTQTHPAATAGTTKEVPVEPEIIVAAPQAAPQNSSAERAEAINLQAIAERHGLAREARELLASDKTLAEVRSTLLALVADRSAQPLPAPVDMSAKEARQYSYTRALLNAVVRAEGGHAARGFEEEVSEELERTLPQNYKKQGGVFVPAQLRTAGSQLDSITSTAGVETKFTEYGGEIIDLLRNYAAVIRSGARVLSGLNGPVTFPKVTADATVSWVAENPGSDVTATAPLLGTVTLSPKTLQGAIPYSRQLLAQSVMAVEAFVRQNLAAGHALAIDRAAIHGSGASNQPTGIYKTSGVNTKAMGGTPTFAKLQDMITEVAVDNALMGALRWMTTPGMAGKLAQTLAESSAGSDHIWTGTYENGLLNGYGALATNQVSAVMSTLDVTGGSSHGIIFGNWSDLMIGFWGGLELVVDPYTLKKQGMIEVASFQMADIQIRHAGSFCVATGATI